MPKGRQFAPELSQLYDVPLQSIENFGLISRTEPGDDDHPSTMGARAVKYALKAGKLGIEDIDLLIYTGMTRDYQPPWVGAWGVLHELGATNVAGLDLTNRCASVLDALWIASNMVKTDAYRRVIVCCADRFDYVFDINNPAKTPKDLAYSAGAAAAVICRESATEIVAMSHFINNDTSMHLHNVPVAGGTRRGLEEDSFATGLHRARTTLNLGKTMALVNYLVAADRHNIPNVMKKANFDDVDFVVASPLDVRAQIASFAGLGIPPSKTFFMLPRLGHIGPADTLINLGTALLARKKIGTRIILSTRTATAGSALAMRARPSGSTPISVRGSGIPEEEVHEQVKHHA